MSIEFAKKYTLCLCYFACICTASVAQDSMKKQTNVSWSVFTDVYYAFDFARPANHEKASFLYNHKRHNEATINLALVSLSYRDSTKRATLGLMAGTYPQYNLAAEPLVFQHIYEANAGIKLTNRKEVWLDAGILPSHIGFESAISKDCWTLTRSILAENSPYYEAGLRASYKPPNQKWYIAVLILNGWQRIKRIDANNTPSFGTQITYTPSDKFVINSSTFVGNDKPDSSRKWRYFHNLYSTWQLSNYWGITMGFDIGLEQKQRLSSNLNTWYSPVVIVRYQNKNWAAAARAEYYQDNDGVIATLINNGPFQMQGYSVNIDRIVGKGFLFRIEGRWFKNASDYFIHRSGLSSKNFQLTSSLAFAF